MGRPEWSLSLPAPEAMRRGLVDDLISAYAAVDVLPIQEDLVKVFPHM